MVDHGGESREATAVLVKSPGFAVGTFTCGDDQGLAATSCSSTANRVIDVVGRIRALVKKAAPRQDEFQIDEAIDEVISLTHGEIAKNGVALHREFAAGLPLVTPIAYSCNK